MRRTEAHQGVRVIKFVDVLGRYEALEFNQLEAAELLGVGERTFRRWRQRFEDDGEAGLLDFADALDAVADGGGGFTGGVAGQVLVFHGRDFDVDIDAVEEGAGDAVAVALNVGGTPPDCASNALTNARFIFESCDAE